MYNIEGKKILVTGARGYVGTALCAEIESRGGIPIEHDIDGVPTNDITKWGWVQSAIYQEPDAIIHLAAHKYATSAEEIPVDVTKLNINGTTNVVEAASVLNIPLVFASTCKAADPCTVYGASKLIGERIVRNADKHVLRFVNILDSVGSVLRIWKNVPRNQPLPVTDCTRMWMSTKQAVEALLETLSHPPGIYGPLVEEPSPVSQLANHYFPKRELDYIPLRRGDRQDERLIAEYETKRVVSPQLVRITGPWDVQG